MGEDAYQASNSLWTRPELLDGPGSPKQALRDLGIETDVWITHFYQGATKGVGSYDWEYAGKADLFVTFDLAKWGLWRGLSINVHQEWAWGISPNFAQGILLPVNVAWTSPTAAYKLSRREPHIPNVLTPPTSLTSDQSRGNAPASPRLYPRTLRVQMAQRPSIDEQLKEAKAPKRSRLEKMIRDNQDFDMLQPEEFDDGWPIPPWLRVAWRKQHPEITLPARNPGPAYPEFLSQVYMRMVANPNDAWGTNSSEAPPASPRRRR